ncbi:MAG TPA: hypothetical protein VLJ11_07945 [Bryobacteraceae bacterium]|nr:hypothetical protein [Bryobacteraceae bacterium]
MDLICIEHSIQSATPLIPALSVSGSTRRRAVLTTGRMGIFGPEPSTLMDIPLISVIAELKQSGELPSDCQYRSSPYAYSILTLHALVRLHFLFATLPIAVNHLPQT